MQKTKLVIASILKPVDDTRMYEKFGISLSQTNKYDINIIGFYTKNIPEVPSITFHPIFRFNRLSFARLFAPLKFLMLVIKLKPKILIINTHELLIVTWLYKILFGCKLIYDVRENYYRNILYTKAFPRLLSPLIASYVRAKEYTSTLFVNHYFLAERQYGNEFTFSRGKSTVIENKFKPQDLGKHSYIKKSEITLLFSGTIAESTGVFHPIELVKGLRNSGADIHLRIIGYCALPKTLVRVKKKITDVDFIELIGGGKLVSHKEILIATQTADFGIVCYPRNYSTMNATPTKLFEYLGLGLPILLQNHEPWVQLASQHDACIPINFEQIDYRVLLEKMQAKQFYQNIKNSDILWISEEEKLLKILNIY